MKYDKDKLEAKVRKNEIRIEIATLEIKISRKK